MPDLRSIAKEVKAPQNGQTCRFRSRLPTPTKLACEILSWRTQSFWRNAYHLVFTLEQEHNLGMRLRHPPRKGSGGDNFKMHLVPCSCGATFAVSEDYDRKGTTWSRFLICPNCGKRHDPKNPLLELGFHREGYWKVDKC